ncbi:MAG: TM2 domain-containing protein [Muribaculaceae bacterium]|nr:TM2 domain-containing protein [Muribaculaceae bacterium]
MSMIPCPRCGERIDSQATKCPYCRSWIRNSQTGPTPPPQFDGNYLQSPFERNELFAESPEGRNRGLCALFAFLLGTLGIQYFYIGKTTAGVICLLVTLFSCGTITQILGFVQGIIMLTQSNEEWRRRYLLNPSTFPF